MNHTMPDTIRRAAAITAVVALGVTACGNDDDGPTAASSPTTPTESTPTSPTTDSPTTSPTPTSEPTAPPTPTPGTTSPATASAPLGSVLRLQDVPEAYPGGYVAEGEIQTVQAPPSVPSVNYESCSTFVPEGEPGPAEPDAVAGAATSFIAGNAQVDEYVVRYASQAAATTAVDRHRELAVDCADAVAARAGTSGPATATLGGAVPAAVNGYRVAARFGSGSAAFEEYSAVLQWGDRVAYLGMRPSNGPTTLDVGWTDRVAAAASTRMVEAE
jgi:hypothetical protein